MKHMSEQQCDEMASALVSAMEKAYCKGGRKFADATPEERCQMAGVLFAGAQVMYASTGACWIDFLVDFLARTAATHCGPVSQDAN